MALKLPSQNSSIEQANKKTSAGSVKLSDDLEQLGEIVRHLLNDKNLEVSKVRPFFWSLVETYIDRFHLYPFDVTKVLFNYLELNGCPPAELSTLISQLENLYEKNHGQHSQAAPLEVTPIESTQLPSEDEMMDLRACIQYAARVSEN